MTDTNKFLAELNYRIHLRDVADILRTVHKSQRDIVKKRALEFVIDKLEAGVQRSSKRSLTLNVNV